MGNEGLWKDYDCRVRKNYICGPNLHSRSRDNKQGDDKLKDIEEDNFHEKSFEEGTSSTENAKSEIEAMIKRRKNGKENITKISSDNNNSNESIESNSEETTKQSVESSSKSNESN